MGAIFNYFLINRNNGAWNGGQNLKSIIRFFVNSIDSRN
jgi:hypothetical protein